jgi:uncharacterized membrane protein
MIGEEYAVCGRCLVKASTLLVVLVALSCVGAFAH